MEVEKEFSVGDIVEWNSQSGGFSKTKIGEIFCLVKEGEIPFKPIENKKYYELPDGKKIPYKKAKYGGGSHRKGLSYIVRVEMKYYYWPIAKKLFIHKEPELKSIESKPSENTSSYWIYDSIESEYPKITENSGKWLVFVELCELDQWWEKIKKLLHEGKLGNHAKTSTAKTNSNATSKNIKVICVYAYNADDKDDVLRIRDSLRSIGVNWKIPLNLILILKLVNTLKKDIKTYRYITYKK